MNYSGKLDLLKLQGAFAINIQGKTATKECVCIPIKDNHLFVGEKGIYLDLSAREIAPEKRVSGDSHIITQSLPKDVFNALTEEEKKNRPILGSMREFQPQGMEITQTVKPSAEEDLPF